jgi:PAS domain S-box-containing protein
VDAALARDSDLTAEGLAREIRQAYPNASVHVGNAWADLRQASRWYVYRDPSVARQASNGDWWHDPDLPRTVAEANGRYVDANEAASQLFGVPRATIVGASIGSFTRHEDDQALGQRLFEELTRCGELCSTAVVVTPSGAEVPIEFRTTRSDNDDSFTTIMRPVAAAG